MLHSSLPLEEQVLVVLGCRIQGSGFRVQGLGFRTWEEQVFVVLGCKV